MKIALFSELPIGGARDAVNEIGKQLKKTHQVDIFYVDSIEDKKEKDFFSNSYFYKFTPKIWKGKNWKIRVYKDTRELIELNSLHKKIASDIDKGQYDLAFIHGSKYIEAPFILKFIKIPKVFYCHDPHYRIIYEPLLNLTISVGLFHFVYEKINRAIRKILDRQNIFCADILLANSLYTQQAIQKSYGRDSIVAYLGVDTDFFIPKKRKKIIDITYIGSRLALDGYPLFQETIAHLSVKTRIKTVFSEEGRLSKAQMRELYQESKIILCLASNEPFGMIPLEAMACGTSVIAVNEGGYKDTVIDGKTGFLVPRNSLILAEKIQFLLQNQKLRSTFGRNGRALVVQLWTWEKRVKFIDKILKNV